MLFGSKVYHQDQNWQGKVLAYHLAYSDVVDVVAPWDWVPEYALRNMLYPYFLSLPIKLLRATGFDSNFLVVNSMYAMNTLIITTTDYFTFRLADRFLGRSGAKITLVV